MTRALAALLMVMAADAPPDAGVPRSIRADTRDRAAACRRTLAEGFDVELYGKKTRLAAVVNPYFQSMRPFDADLRGVCLKHLGDGWRIAQGSFGASFLADLRGKVTESVREAFDTCAVRYRVVDTVCAPCVQGSAHCPCSTREISSFLFCERAAQP